MEIGPLQTDQQNIAVAPVSTSPEVMAQNRELIQAVKSVNAAEHFGADNELTFLLDRHTQRPIIRVVNTKTKEVIQQIPPQFVLELAKRPGESSA
jgi:flagellar protein FlaG